MMLLLDKDDTGQDVYGHCWFFTSTMYMLLPYTCYTILNYLLLRNNKYKWNTKYGTDMLQLGLKNNQFVILRSQLSILSQHSAY